MFQAGFRAEVVVKDDSVYFLVRDGFRPFTHQFIVVIVEGFIPIYIKNTRNVTGHDEVTLCRGIVDIQRRHQSRI
jgi:hypothetical protein